MTKNPKSHVAGLFSLPELQPFAKAIAGLPLQGQWHNLNTFIEELAPDRARWVGRELSKTELAEEINVLSRTLEQLMAEIPEVRRAELAAEYAEEIRDSEAWDEAAANPKALDALSAQLDEALAEGSTRPLFPKS